MKQRHKVSSAIRRSKIYENNGGTDRAILRLLTKGHVIDMGAGVLMYAKSLRSGCRCEYCLEAKIWRARLREPEIKEFDF